MSICLKTPHEEPLDRVENKILGRLTSSDRNFIEYECDVVDFSARDSIEITNHPIRHVYFPESGLLSVIAKRKDKISDVGLIGCEGMTGIAIVLGGDRAAHDTLVQTPGRACRISAERLRSAIDDRPSLRASLLEFVYDYAQQIAHTSLASAQGKLVERLARWLLMANDRVSGNKLVLTQDSIAHILGVRRASITEALNQLQEKAAISTARGSITIENRARLQTLSNGLYGRPESEPFRSSST